jgi:uncharacterized protein (TIGR00369 family)
MAHPILGSVPQADWPATIQQAASAGLAGMLGVEILQLEHGLMRAKMELRDEHLLLAGGLIHAGTVVSFADTCAGWGCLVSLPESAQGFATIELKTNFVATARGGQTLECEATMVHGGRTTQVWDAIVRRAGEDRTVGIYRCTQALLTERRS